MEREKEKNEISRYPSVVARFPFASHPGNTICLRDISRGCRRPRFFRFSLPAVRYFLSLFLLQRGNYLAICLERTAATGSTLGTAHTWSHSVKRGNFGFLSLFLFRVLRSSYIRHARSLAGSPYVSVRGHVRGLSCARINNGRVIRQRQQTTDTLQLLSRIR